MLGSRRVRFLSTYETVTSFYRDVPPSLADSGADVEVVFSGATYREVDDRLDGALAGSNVTVTYIPTGLRRANSRPRKLWAMIAYVAGIIVRTLFGRRVDVNVFFSTPPLFAIWGTVLMWLRGQPYVCVVMDVYPHVLVESGALSKNSMLTIALRRLMRTAWRNARSVVVIGRCMAEILVEEGVREEQIEVIPNWAHSAMARPTAKAQVENLRREWGLADKFVVLYSGNIGVSHTFDEIIAAARSLRQRANIAFVFIGDGVRRAELETAKRRHRLDNVTLLPFQPSERLGASLSVADVHFISLRRGFAGLVVPSKAYGCMASGRPLIYVGESRGEIARSIESFGLGRVVPPGDVELLVESVLYYVEDPESREDAGKRALESYRTIFSADRALKRYKSVLLR